MTGQKYLGLIPARGGSKRIPGKNIKALAGKPLIVHSIEAALQSKALWKVVVSTDDPAIANLVKETGAELPFLRPKHLATDNSTTLDVVKHTLKYYAAQCMTPTAVIILQPTSPLRTSEDIIDSIALFEKFGADTLVSVVEDPIKLSTIVYPKSYNKDLWLREPKKRIFSDAFHLNGAIYISSVATINKFDSLYGEKIIGYRMPKERSIDIDTEGDWRMAEKLMDRRD